MRKKTATKKVAKKPEKVYKRIMVTISSPGERPVTRILDNGDSYAAHFTTGIDWDDDVLRKTHVLTMEWV